VNFFYRNLSFFTCKSGAERKLCNGVNKTPQFLLFSTAKGGTKTIAHLSIAEGYTFLKSQIGSFTTFTIVNCGMKKKIKSKCAMNIHGRHLIFLPNWQVKNKEGL
jgi:hypothetical protein